MKMEHFTTIYGKPNDCHNFLHYKLAHPKALKDSTRYSQPSHIKQICCETTEGIKQLKDLRDAFIKRGYQSRILDHQFERAISID